MSCILGSRNILTASNHIEAISLICVILMAWPQRVCAHPTQSNLENIGSVTVAAGQAQPLKRPGLAQVVVTAARMAPPLTLAPTTSFSQQDLVDSGALDLPALLPAVAGAQVVRNGGPGATSSLFLRGAAATQTLVLIDGVRIDSASLGSTQLAQLMLAQFERVEVVSGNVSALYGSNAIGGVVQIFTKAGGQQHPKLNFLAEIGSHHTQHQQVGISGALNSAGATTFSLYGSRLKTEGLASANTKRLQPAHPNAYDFFNESITAALKHRFNPAWLAELRFYQSHGTVGSDQAYGYPTDLNLANNRVQAVSVFVAGQLSEAWRTSLMMANGQEQNLNWLNGKFDNRFSTSNRQLTWHNELCLRPRQRLQFGYEYLQQNLDTSLYAAASRQVHATFVGYQAGFGAHQLQLNLRRDHYTNFGGADSYYVGYGYDFNPHWKFTSSYSNAFRVPSFNDLYYPHYGNLRLQPESSHSIEAGIEHRSDQWGRARVNVFQTRYEDLIEAAPINPATLQLPKLANLYQAQNLGRARVQGLEASWYGHVRGTRIRASLTTQRAIDEVHKQDLPRRARHFASLLATRQLGDWRVGGMWSASSRRNDNGAVLGGYGVLNLNARYDLSRSWYAATRIENVFNKHHELAYAYRAVPRGIYFTLGWQQR